MRFQSAGADEPATHPGVSRRSCRRTAGFATLENMKIDIVSVFPEYFDVLNLSLFGKAQEKGLVTVTAHNLRDWTHDVHHSVDDTPAGGGAGMVMKPEVWAECLDDLLGLAPAVIAPDAVSSDAHDDDSASVSPSDAVNSAEAADTTDAADSGHAGNPTDAAASVTSIVSSRIPRRRCSRSATRPNSRTPIICCSAAADTRAMTRESLSITARRASTYANTRSVTTC